MKNILVPSDLSDVSENALKMAVDLSEKLNGEIFLINFTEHPLGKSFSATGEMDKKYADEENVYTISLVKSYQKQLAALAAKYSTAHRNVNYQVYDQDLKKGVVDFVREHNIDLIVMGTTGEESADEFFLGNNTEQVIEVATCPIISVKERYVRSGFERIVLGLSPERDRHDNFLQAATYLKDLAGALDSKIDIVHVLDPETNDKDEKLKELEGFASKFKLGNYSITLIEHEDKEKGLIEYANRHRAGLLAVFTHAEDGFFRIFRSSFSEELTMSSDVPVLTINLHNV